MSIYTARIVLDLPEKLKNRLEAEAEKRMVSRAALIRMIFAEWLENHESKKKKKN